MEYLAEHGHEFDAIHASPPCQFHSSLKSMPNAKTHIDLIPQTRAGLKAIGKPWVIENVMGAPLLNPVMLCGTMFGLGVKAAAAELRRHRLFEASFMLLAGDCQHFSRDKMKRLVDEGKISRSTVQVVGVYGGGGLHSTRPARKPRPRPFGVWGNAGGISVRDGVQQFSTKERAEAMGIDWMTGKELSQAIPRPTRNSSASSSSSTSSMPLQHALARRQKGRSENYAY